ncbi:MAG: tRNA (guanosine(46)-N7)-methyltransferase TrmB [Verrucomicrobiales bacterium]|nr:tRNA (guanosine(46)-N7)-methyltransferase TrmB [Verrucomicrobiales bacterium]
MTGGRATNEPKEQRLAGQGSDRPTLIYRPASITDRLDVASLFPIAQPLEIELGSGDGSFLAEYAGRHPERNFIGVERLLGRLRKLDRKGLRTGLTNLRLFRIEASYFVEYLLARESVKTFHLYFPDPWPKRKHRKNRLVNEHFAEKAHRALQPGGVVYLRTDDADYFAQMKVVFDANANFHPIEMPPELVNLVTDFEREFSQRGIETLRAAYQRE